MTSIRATNFASDPALLMNVRFSVAAIGKCSCPPMMRSISGKRSASCAILLEGEMGERDDDVHPLALRIIGR